MCSFGLVSCYGYATETWQYLHDDLYSVVVLHGDFVLHNSRDPERALDRGYVHYLIFPYFPDTQAFWFLCCTSSQPPSETCPP